MNSKFLLIVIVGLVVVSLSVYGITLLNEKDTQLKFEFVHNFNRDKAGLLQIWCNENNGQWDKIEFVCGWINEEDGIKAHVDLESRKNVQVNEIYSSIICDKMQMQCPDNPQFDGNFSMDSGRTHVTAHKKGMDGAFYFDITDPDILHFRTCATEEYDDYEDECKWQSFSVENELLYRIYSERYQDFENSMGFSNNFNGTVLEPWCVGSNGMWEKSENTCFFVTDADYELADIALEELWRPHISQEKTQAICKFLEMDCPSHASFKGGFDMDTGRTTVHYEYKKIQYKFDVTDDTIKYSIGRSSSDWTNINSSHIPGDTNPSIELNKESYTWTDMVHLTIIAPSYADNGVTDMIGDSDDFKIDISTLRFSLNNYKISETKDLGIFTANVVLTGFPHDVNGNHLTGDKNGNDATGEGPSGRGPYDGLLPSKNPDNLVVIIKRPNQDNIVKSVPINWNEGEIQWLESGYPSSGTGVIRVIDPDMNLNPKKVDWFDVYVWSDTDLVGIEVNVTETNDETGVFEGTVFFTTIDASSGHRLKVTSGDIIHAKYEDRTLPYPNNQNNELNIISTARIDRNETQ